MITQPEITTFEQVRGGFGYNVIKEGGQMILDFATPYDLLIANMCFKKLLIQKLIKLHSKNRLFS